MPLVTGIATSWQSTSSSSSFFFPWNPLKVKTLNSFLLGLNLIRTPPSKPKYMLGTFVLKCFEVFSMIYYEVLMKTITYEFLEKYFRLFLEHSIAPKYYFGVFLRTLQIGVFWNVLKILSNNTFLFSSFHLSLECFPFPN